MERLHRTLLDEHFRVAGRTTWYESVEQMQEDFDKYLHHYSYERPQQGRMMNGRTPSQAFIEGIVEQPEPATEDAAELSPGTGPVSGEYLICTTLGFICADECIVFR